jgi:hypothetical protein
MSTLSRCEGRRVKATMCPLIPRSGQAWARKKQESNEGLATSGMLLASLHAALVFGLLATHTYESVCPKCGSSVKQTPFFVMSHENKHTLK